MKAPAHGPAVRRARGDYNPGSQLRCVHMTGEDTHCNSVVRKKSHWYCARHMNLVARDGGNEYGPMHQRQKG